MTTRKHHSPAGPTPQNPTLSDLCRKGDQEACELRSELRRNGMKGRQVEEMAAASLLRRRTENSRQGPERKRLGNTPIPAEEWARRCAAGEGLACAVQGWINGCNSGTASDCTKVGLAYNQGASTGKSIPLVPSEVLRHFKLACRLDVAGDECWENGLILAKGEEFCPGDADIEWFFAQACQKSPRKHCAAAAYVYEHGYSILPCIERTNLAARKKRYNRRACSAGDVVACSKLESK